MSGVKNLGAALACDPSKVALDGPLPFQDVTRWSSRAPRLESATDPTDRLRLRCLLALVALDQIPFDLGEAGGRGPCANGDSTERMPRND